MSNYKHLKLLCFGAVTLFGCKPSSQFFSYEKSVDLKFFDRVRGDLVNALGNENESAIVFTAQLKERLVERDDVPEYKLINELSDQKYANLPDTKGRSYLYLFELLPKGGGDTVIVYLGTSYSQEGVCTNVGPAYAGKLRNTGDASEVYFTQAYRVKKLKKCHMTAQQKKLSKEIQQTIYFLKPTDDINMTFINSLPYVHGSGDTAFLQVEQIIQDTASKKGNKIGGNKAVIYTTSDVFGDAKALRFKYFGTISH